MGRPISWRPSALSALFAAACGLAGCGPPYVDVRVLTPLPKAARAPAAEAEREVVTAERLLADARGEVERAAVEVEEAAAVAARPAAAGQAAFATTDLAYKRQVLDQRRLVVVLSDRRLALARARHELAKARVVDENSLPEAVDLDLDAFRREVEEAAAAVGQAQRDADTLAQRLAILRKAVHAARVASLRAQ